ncbi:MAG: hypothetical protein K2J08_09150 [Ruminococcus sp.]|nr:hypothetical protein [Ruminococcus sp.]
MDNFNSKEYCDWCVDFVRQFEKNFTGKPEDVSDMDNILEIIHNDYREGKITENMAWQVAFNMGVYLGQIMLDNFLSEYGFLWAVDEGEPYLRKDSKNHMYPLGKVMKRIVNGREDDVKSFYDVAVYLAQKSMK